MATRPHQAVAPDSSTTDLHATPPHAIAPPRGHFKRHPATTVSSRSTAGEAIDFSPPTSSKLKVRPAAHLVDGDYIARFGKGIQLLGDLPPEDPRNLYQQLPIHCSPYHHKEEEEEEEPPGAHGSANPFPEPSSGLSFLNLPLNIATCQVPVDARLGWLGSSGARLPF
uniref:Polyphenol oxidase I, chloroplastic n=1 Tax=Anthurium amnicola TaxID=1678845 RepID=A0A1D1XG85_9ARAE